MNPATPLYRQSFPYSCGPASLIMALGALSPDLDLNQELEVALWNDSNLGESRATSSYGLALAALRRGFGARVYANGKGVGFIGSILEHFPAANGNNIRQHFELQKVRARELGVEEVARKTELNDIRAELECFPIVLISSKMMGDFIGIPHWVLVTGVDDGNVTINNPETGRSESYSHKRFLKYLGWGDQTRMVCVFLK
ncbi:MAG: peptidase C39 family protein [Thermoplasmata archaeon]|nr:peptidase C39 family protein [Thermoplasmata archaeon]